MDGTLWKRLGWDFRCLVRFTDGSRRRVDGLAVDGRYVAETLVARCPDALDQGPSSAWRLIPVLIVLFAAGAAGSIYALNAELVSGDSGSLLVGLALAISLMGLLFSGFGLLAYLGRRR
jgi:hypothetical protein